MRTLLKDPYEYLYGNVHWELGEKGENLHDALQFLGGEEAKFDETTGSL